MGFVQRLVLFLLAGLLARGVLALELARELSAAGAPQLALVRVEQFQPRDFTAPRWAEWEALRLGLLVELGRHREALERARALPADLPQPLLRQCLLAAARAAVAAGRGAEARAYAARLLWQLGPTPEEARAARLLVIESYLAEEQGEAALRAMLRFDQDHAPLERALAARFVEGLLALGMPAQAVNWLARLDETSSLKLLLRLRSGLAAPAEALAQARAALAKGGEAGHWRVVAEATRSLGEPLPALEALERSLDAARAGETAARELWEAYLAAAREAGNRHQLLVGEDANWADFAARRLADSPVLARALFAHLARHGASRAARQGAELQLVLSLHQSGLDRAALRLFAERDPSEMDAQTRHLLGSLAEARNAPALAARLWQGLAAPPAVPAEEWAVRLAAVEWRAGKVEQSAARLRALLGQRRPLPPAAAARARQLLEEMLAVDSSAPAEELLAALLPLAAAEARPILLALARSAEATARYAQAAHYYLRAALAGAAPDALAAQARLAAALNLARAGFREDARAQFEWVLEHSKDAAQRDIARRELSRW
jgi:hypothetical protein